MTSSDYTPQGFEKGTPGWDIGIILTRHRTADDPCAKVVVLRGNTKQRSSAQRLKEARRVPCTCDAGDSLAEFTSKI